MKNEKAILYLKKEAGDFRDMAENEKMKGKEEDAKLLMLAATVLNIVCAAFCKLEDEK
jgi:hypothetical protein